MTFHRIAPYAAAGFIFLAMLWGILCLRAYGHYQDGVVFMDEGRSLESAREFESAIGCYAPFNPFIRPAAEHMLALAQLNSGKHPELALEITRRCQRSLRSLRWLLQPHRNLLAQAEGENGATELNDPHPIAFFLSFLCLLLGLGAFWLPLKSMFLKGTLCLAGMGGWAIFLYLC